MSELFTIEKDKNWEKLRIALTKSFNKNVRREIENEIITGANNIRNRIILSMRNTPRTGRINKRIKKGSRKRDGVRIFKSANVIRRSSPGNPPAPDFGDLIGRIIVNKRLSRGEVEVGAGRTSAKGKALLYAPHLEKGTENMKARPFLEPAADIEIPIIEKNIFIAVKDKAMRDSLQ